MQTVSGLMIREGLGCRSGITLELNQKKKSKVFQLCRREFNKRSGEAEERGIFNLIFGFLVKNSLSFLLIATDFMG